MSDKASKMTDGGGVASGPVSDLRQVLRAYSTPSTRDSLIQLGVTIGLFVLSLSIMYVVMMDVGYWAALVMAVPAGLLLVRTFIIQHDCGHYSFFRQKWACDALGRVLGIITLTPYLWWKRDHDWHHATSGNLDKRGYGDIGTLTVAEYTALGKFDRALYRLYRHPVILFVIGPIYQFVIRQRLAINIRNRDRSAAASVHWTNLAIAIVVVAVSLMIGLVTFLKLWLPVIAVSSCAGVWMFFIQHQFEETYWQRDPNWSFEQAALRGCSYYKLPRILEWMTGYIGYHHIHHLASKIPNYKLKPCFENVPTLRQVTTLNLRDSLKCARLALWDEREQRLIAFADLAPA